jgi:hypothetical protein
MDPYVFTLALGGAGLVAMAATGFAAHGHAGDTHSTDVHAGHLHPGDVHHGFDAAHPGTGAHQGAHHGAHTHDSGSAIRSALLALMSPRVLFSLLFGFGITGFALRHYTGGAVQLALAVLGAIVFEMALVAPTWRFLFRFASAPAGTLESAIMSEARAASGFDANGQGLVALEVNGEIVQCLGTLRADDRALGVRVRAGDLLRVEDVDAERNCCTVAFVSHQVAAS